MADRKISELTAVSAVDDEDLLHVVVDPSGTPANRKVTVANFFAAVPADVGVTERLNVTGYLTAEKTTLPSTGASTPDGSLFYHRANGKHYLVVKTVDGFRSVELADIGL